MRTFINNLLLVLGIRQRTPPSVSVAPAYIRAAMQRATVEWLPNDRIHYAAIPGFQGVYGTGDTAEAARADLESSLADWAAFRLSRGMDVPGVDGQTNAVHA